MLPRNRHITRNAEVFLCSAAQRRRWQTFLTNANSAMARPVWDLPEEEPEEDVAEGGLGSGGPHRPHGANAAQGVRTPSPTRRSRWQDSPAGSPTKSMPPGSPYLATTRQVLSVRAWVHDAVSIVRCCGGRNARDLNPRPRHVLSFTVVHDCVRVTGALVTHALHALHVHHVTCRPTTR